MAPKQSTKLCNRLTAQQLNNLVNKIGCENCGSPEKSKLHGIAWCGCGPCKSILMGVVRSRIRAEQLSKRKSDEW